MMRFLFIAVLALSFAACNETPNSVTVEQSDIAAIDAKVADWMAQNNMPGISLAVSKDGKLVYAKGYGLANKDTGEEVTTASQFRVASVSKLITAAAIMILVQEGEISMDQKVFGTNGILGSTFGTQPYNQYVTDITVSQLLHHTGGGWGQTTDPAFFDITMNKEEVINWTLDNLALTHKPGTAFAYSNFGYMLLAEIIEKVSGKPYNQFINDEILAKVGATHTFIAGSTLADRRPQEAVYYGQKGDIPYVYNMKLARGDGAMGWLSTPTDLLRFSNAVDGLPGRPDILTSSTISIMVTTTPASKGFGWTFGCGWVVLDNEWFWWGTLPGTFAVLYRNDNGISIAATANSRRQPESYKALNSFIPIINYIASEEIPWQHIDQF